MEWSSPFSSASTFVSHKGWIEMTGTGALAPPCPAQQDVTGNPLWRQRGAWLPARSGAASTLHITRKRKIDRSLAVTGAFFKT